MGFLMCLWLVFCVVWGRVIEFFVLSGVLCVIMRVWGLSGVNGFWMLYLLWGVVCANLGCNFLFLWWAGLDSGGLGVGRLGFCVFCGWCGDGLLGGGLCLFSVFIDVGF